MGLSHNSPDSAPQDQYDSSSPGLRAARVETQAHHRARKTAILHILKGRSYASGGWLRGELSIEQFAPEQQQRGACYRVTVAVFDSSSRIAVSREQLRFDVTRTGIVCFAEIFDFKAAQSTDPSRGPETRETPRRPDLDTLKEALDTFRPC